MWQIGKFFGIAKRGQIICQYLVYNSLPSFFCFINDTVPGFAQVLDELCQGGPLGRVHVDVVPVIDVFTIALQKNVNVSDWGKYGWTIFEQEKILNLNRILRTVLSLSKKIKFLKYFFCQFFATFDLKMACLELFLRYKSWLQWNNAVSTFIWIIMK